MPVTTGHPTVIGATGTQTQVNLGLGKVLELGLGLMSFLDQRKEKEADAERQRMKDEQNEAVTTWTLLKGLYEIAGDKQAARRVLVDYASDYLGRGPNTTPEIEKERLNELLKEPPLGTDDWLDAAFRSHLAGVSPKEMIAQSVMERQKAVESTPAVAHGLGTGQERGLTPVVEAKRAALQPLSQMSIEDADRMLATFGGWEPTAENPEPSAEDTKTGVKRWIDYKYSSPTTAAAVKIPLEELKLQLKALEQERDMDRETLELLLRKLGVAEAEIRMLGREQRVNYEENKLNLARDKFAVDQMVEAYNKDLAGVKEKEDVWQALFKMKGYEDPDEAWRAGDKAAQNAYVSWLRALVDAHGGTVVLKEVVSSPEKAGPKLWEELKENLFRPAMESTIGKPLTRSIMGEGETSVPYWEPGEKKKKPLGPLNPYAGGQTRGTEGLEDSEGNAAVPTTGEMDDYRKKRAQMLKELQ